jgi:AraC family transcriptional regulator
MPPSPHATRLLRRFQPVLDFIEAHLDSALDLTALAALAAYSPAHFQRQFAALYGLPIGRYQQWRRLHRAAQMLAYRQDTVTDIALQAGYASPEAFAHAFQRVMGCSPSAFRAQPDWQSWEHILASTQERLPMTDFLASLKIVDEPAIEVLAMTHRGDPRELGETVRRFIIWRRQYGLHPARYRTFNVFHTPPDVAANDFRIDLCVEAPQRSDIDRENVFRTHLPSSRAAVITATGSDTRIRAAFDWLYRDWLPTSGDEPTDHPPWLERIDLALDIPESQRQWRAVVPLTAARRTP